MARNVEIKARVGDMAALREKAAAAADGPAVVILQEDTFFRARHGRLKLRDFGDGRGELISYERPDAPGPKASDYAIVPVADPGAVGRLLAQALGVLGVVRKTRTLYMIGRTRVHLDEVAGLGEFVELEVVLREGEPEGEGARVARDLMARLGIAEADLVEGAYIDLLDGQRRVSS